MSLVPYTNSQLSVGANGTIAPFMSGNACINLVSSAMPQSAANNDMLENFFYNSVGLITIFNLLIAQTVGNIICHANIGIVGVVGSPTGTLRFYSGQTLIKSLPFVSSDSVSPNAYPCIVSAAPVKDLRMSWQSNAVFGTPVTFYLPLSQASQS